MYKEIIMKNFKILVLAGFIIIPKTIFGIVGFGLNVIQDGSKLGASSYTEGSGLTLATVESFEMAALPFGLGGYIFVDLAGWAIELEGNAAYSEYSFTFSNVVTQMEDIPFVWARVSSGVTVKKNIADFSIPLLAKTALSVGIGDFGLAIQAIDKREGSKFKYQFHKAELYIDNKLMFSLNYDRIPYNQTNNVRTLVQFELKKQNLGEYQKLYRLTEHPKMSVHGIEDNGIITLTPGYHKVKILITDAAGNTATAEGILLGTFPMSIDMKEISRDDNQISFEINPIRGGLAIRDATIYSFTPFGFPDEKVKILKSQRKGKNLILSIPKQSPNERILQILATNQIGSIATPYHWPNYNTLRTVLDVNPKLEIVHTEGGIFFQIEMDQYVPGKAKLKLSNDNIFNSFPVNQIQPNIFLSDMLSPKVLENIKYVDVSLNQGELSRDTRFNFMPGIAEPNLKTVIVSKDKNCSVQTLPNTVYSPTAIWIEKVERHAPIKNGYHLSHVYQLQPFDRVLKNEFLLGLRYSNRLSGHTKMGIYYYDEKSEDWVYLKTNNNSDKKILTAKLDQLHAVTIIQDLFPPKILKTYPANGGFYKGEDIKKISINIEDSISGIDPKEKSFEIKLNGNRLFCAYQPVKKQITYDIDRGMDPGDHRLDIAITDRVGNKKNHSISFTCK